MSLMPDMSWVWPEQMDPEAEARRMIAEEAMAGRLFPIPPQVEPQLQPEPGSTFADRLAMGFANTPMPQARGFLPNFLQGAARGFSGGQMGAMRIRADQNERARAEAARTNAENLRATMSGRERWLGRLGEASKAHREESARLREKMFGAALKPSNARPTPKSLLPFGYPKEMETSEADKAMRMIFPDKYRAPRMKPTPPGRVPEDDRVDAAEQAGMTYAQFARDLAGVPSDTLKVHGLSRATLLKRAAKRLKP